MKVCNLETIETIEDAVRLTDYVCEETPQVVIVPSFSWIKNTLQEISVALFHSEHEEALQLAEGLKARCMKFASMLVTEKNAATFAQENLSLRFMYILRLMNGPLNLLDDRELLASSEYISSILIAAYLKAKGMNVSLLESSEFMQLGSNNKPDLEAITAQVKSLTELTHASVYVLQSRLCKNAYGEVEYIPNARTDVYATYVAAAFHADELVLWLHTKGLYTQFGETVYKQGEEYTLTFEEAESFINAGIRLISPACIELARQSGTAIKLMDNKSVRKKALYIGGEQSDHNVKAVVARRNVSYVRLRSLGTVTSFQFLEKSLAVFGKYKVPVFLMTSSSANISMAVELSMDTFYLIRRDVTPFAEMVLESNIATICVLGQFDWDKTSIEGKIIDLLKDIPILMISYGSDNSSVSVAVREKDREQALCALSDAFLGTEFKKENNTHIFREEYNAFIV